MATSTSSAQKTEAAEDEMRRVRLPSDLCLEVVRLIAPQHPHLLYTSRAVTAALREWVEGKKESTIEPNQPST